MELLFEKVISNSSNCKTWMQVFTQVSTTVTADPGASRNSPVSILQRL